MFYARCAEEITKSQEFPTPKEWTLVLNAFARGGYRDSGVWLTHTFDRLKHARLEDWSTMDLSLLCNSISKLAVSVDARHQEDAVDVSRSHLLLFQRVAVQLPAALSSSGRACSGQDVVQLLAAFAALPCLEGRSVARQVCCMILHNVPVAQHVETLPPDGLCAVLNSLLRCGVGGEPESGVVFRAAYNRLLRSAFQLSVAHLAHVAHAFATWPTQSMIADAGPTLDEVDHLFKSSLRPAVLRAATDVETRWSPGHAAFIIWALTRVGESDRRAEDMAPVLAVARRLRDAQRTDAPRQLEPLRWEAWPSWSLSMLASSIARLGGTGWPQEAADESECPVQSVSGSLSDFILGPEAGTCDERKPDEISSGSCRLAGMGMDSVCHIAGAFHFAPRGVEVCEAAVAIALESRPNKISVPNVSLLLTAMSYLEMHNGRALGKLLWFVHRTLWEAPSDADVSDSFERRVMEVGIDLHVVSKLFAALDRLDCFQAISSCTEASAAFECVTSATVVCLRRDIRPSVTNLSALHSLIRPSLRALSAEASPADSVAILVDHLAWSFSTLDWQRWPHKGLTGLVPALGELALSTALSEQRSAALWSSWRALLLQDPRVELRSAGFANSLAAASAARISGSLVRHLTEGLALAGGLASLQLRHLASAARSLAVMKAEKQHAELAVEVVELIALRLVQSSPGEETRVATAQLVLLLLAARFGLGPGLLFDALGLRTLRAVDSAVCASSGMIRESGGGSLGVARHPDQCWEETRHCAEQLWAGDPDTLTFVEPEA